MPHHKFHRTERTAGILGALAVTFAATAAAQGPPSMPVSGAEGQAPAGLRLFEIPKPPAAESGEAAPSLPIAPARGPLSNESLQMTAGLGYVQGADWGIEALAGGSFSGVQVQLNSLVTSGREGLLMDYGSLSLFDPDRKWQVEAGDVFSRLRGLARGGRVSWMRGKRRPGVAVYGPGRASINRQTVFAYRDQIYLGGRRLFETEVATDRSFLLTSGFASRRLNLEAFYRSVRLPISVRDLSLSGDLNVWRGLAVSAGMFRSIEPGDRSRWGVIGMRMPLRRFLDVGFERTFAESRERSQQSTAVMAHVVAPKLNVFHRYQTGGYEFASSGRSTVLERRQNQSMTTYSPGARVNLTLQLVTQMTDGGQTQHWEELQTTVKVTPTTALRTVTGFPGVSNRDHLQVYFRQGLPQRLAFQIDYGRVSAYQSIVRELDRMRFKVMLLKTVDVKTPVRGATVTGRVLDTSGHGVAGARVKLGPYTADTNAAGVYELAHMPRGEYDLSLEPYLLPADFAWDGRGERIEVGSGGTCRADLKVTPLNAIHGRVYVDRNRNHRFDAGEGVAGAVLVAGDRLTATDQEGAYGFYNVLPDTYEIQLRTVPPEYDPETRNLTVTLQDGSPVTKVDFRLTKREKPIVWENSR